jgi:hypothetical protein
MQDAQHKAFPASKGPEDLNDTLPALVVTSAPLHCLLQYYLVLRSSLKKENKFFGRRMATQEHTIVIWC